MQNPYNDALASDLHDVSSQVINYREGFDHALNGEDLTVIRSKHYSIGFDVIERVFKKLNLDKLGYDHRYYYRKLHFNFNEIIRISDEVEPHINKLTYQFRLKDHSPDPSKLDDLFLELFEIITLDDADKNRFQASLSLLMSQVINDILGLPSDRSRFALVLYGTQGCGKTTFNTVLCNVLIGKDVTLSKNNLYSNFDSLELCNPVIRVEDLDYDFRDNLDRMKSYITNTTIATINVKYKPEQRVLIRTTPLMDTNNDFINIIKSDGEQRRFCIFQLQSPKARHKFDEARLYEVLDEIFKAHSYERYYNEKKLMRINRELSDPHTNIVEDVKNVILTDYIINGKTVKYSKTELKEMIKKALSEKDNFVSDNLYLRIQKDLMTTEYSSRRKSQVYFLKDYYLNSGKKSNERESAVKDGNFKGRVMTGNDGGSERPYKGGLGRNFFQIPVITRPHPSSLKEKIPALELYPPEELSSLTLEKYAEDYRDFFIDNVIIENNKVLFHDYLRRVDSIPPEQLESSEDESSEEIEDTREVIQLSDFKAIYPPILYLAKVKENHHNTQFKSRATLADLEMFKKAVQWDHIGGNFTDSIATNGNFLSTNIFVIDIDAHDGEDLSNIDDINKLGLEYYRVLSKSGEGYHLYFPLSHQIEDEVQYRIAYVSLCEAIKELGIQPDEACKNPSRKWFATTHHNKAIHNDGDKFNILKALSKHYRIEGYEKDRGSPLPKVQPSEMVKSEPSPDDDKSTLLKAWGLRESNVLTNPIRKDVEYDPPPVVSGNRTLTDKYYHGELNKGQVHEDIPHMINYLLFLKSKGEDFKSDIDRTKIPVDEVINRLKEVVSYDIGHVDLIEWILDKYQE